MPTLKEQIGQMLMVGLSGEQLTAEEERTLRECAFGGVILFGANCRAPDQIGALCQSLWRTAGGLPPFIALDHEGGRVHRLPEPFTHFPSARAIGATRDPELAYRIARAMAVELLIAGVNVNFAPVLDLGSNPQNAVIGDRAFAGNPGEVIRFTNGFITGLRQGGIIPCGKHFPGHGATDVDSHLKLPRVDKPFPALLQTDFRPFAEACRGRLEALMTAHVVYAALDPEHPATLSQNIITGLLRREWGYSGLVFSDDLDMAAVCGNYSLEESVRLAVAGGVDVLLYGHGSARAARAFESLNEWSETDPVLRARIAESYERIRRLKRRFLKTFRGAPPAELSGRLAALNHRQLSGRVKALCRRCS